jgi:hypothetical protein
VRSSLRAVPATGFCRLFTNVAVFSPSSIVSRTDSDFPMRVMRPAACWLLSVALLSVCLPGCVRRRMTVLSDPPGALVYVDDQEVGVTPVSAPFTYYGTRKIQLVKDGYETLTVKQTFSPPWYEIPPLDFVSENLWPHETRDEQLVNFQLQPQQVLPTEKLLERAEGMRVGARQGYVASLPNATTRPEPILPMPSPQFNLPPPAVSPAP